MKRLLYVIGQPGSGKTTAVDAALQLLRIRGRGSGVGGFATEVLAWGGDAAPAQHLQRRAFGLYLGRHRGEFSGTDALSLSVQPRVLTLLREWDQCAFAGVVPTLVIGEGDRLGNASFFTAVVERGWTLDLVHLNTPAGLAASRRLQRRRQQNPTWVQGRATKVQALAAAWPHRTLAGGDGIGYVAEQMASILRENYEAANAQAIARWRETGGDDIWTPHSERHREEVGE